VKRERFRVQGFSLRAKGEGFRAYDLRFRV
jgi:hypothetical protein